MKLYNCMRVSAKETCPTLFSVSTLCWSIGLDHFRIGGVGKNRRINNRFRYSGKLTFRVEQDKSRTLKVVVAADASLSRGEPKVWTWGAGWTVFGEAPDLLFI